MSFRRLTSLELPPSEAAVKGLAAFRSLVLLGLVVVLIIGNGAGAA